MNISRLHEILSETTDQYRKGPVAVTDLGPVKVTHVYAMPHAEDAPPGLEMIDCHFVQVGVDKEKAETRRAELFSILQSYEPREELAGGPSYINVGARIGDQGAAFQLFALGEVLGFWKVITPADMGFEGAEADLMAGNGLIMCTGLRQ